MLLNMWYPITTYLDCGYLCKMENTDEGKSLSLKYKGEDYERVKMELYLGGFISLGEERWQSPTTGRMYKFIIYDTPPYVVRMEELDGSDIVRIDTNFCNKEDALNKYNESHKRKKPHNQLKSIKKSILDSFNPPVPILGFIHKFNKRKYNDGFSELLDLLKSEELRLDDFLNVVHPVYNNKVACMATWRYSDDAIKTVSIGEREYYIIPASRTYEGYIDSIISKIRLRALIGDKMLHELENNKAEH